MGIPPTATPSPPTPAPAPPTLTPGPPAVAPAATTSGWQKPEVILAIVAALISMVAIVISIRAGKLASDANNIARHANEISGTHNTLEAETALTGSSDSLQKRFKDAGIDDVPALANFLRQLESNHRAGVISDDFYQQQIKSWCPITHQAYEKLRITWIDDKSFREFHQTEPWFLARLDKMVAPPNDKGNCL